MKFFCPNEDCDESFHKRLALREHLLYVHNNLDSIHTCPICSVTFQSMKHLSLHEKQQHGEYECKVCGQNFSEKSYLNAHSQVHLINRPQYDCTYCNKRYLYKANLSTHIKNKHIKIKFICGFCTKELSTKQKLEDHLARKHYGAEDNLENEISFIEDYSDAEPVKIVRNSVENESSTDFSNSEPVEFTQEDFDLLDLDI